MRHLTKRTSVTLLFFAYQTRREQVNKPGAGLKNNQNAQGNKKKKKKKKNRAAKRNSYIKKLIQNSI